MDMVLTSCRVSIRGRSTTERAGQLLHLAQSDDTQQSYRAFDRDTMENSLMIIYTDNIMEQPAHSSLNGHDLQHTTLTQSLIQVSLSLVTHPPPHSFEIQFFGCFHSLDYSP